MKSARPKSRRGLMIDVSRVKNFSHSTFIPPLLPSRNCYTFLFLYSSKKRKNKSVFVCKLAYGDTNENISFLSCKDLKISVLVTKKQIAALLNSVKFKIMFRTWKRAAQSLFVKCIKTFWTSMRKGRTELYYEY